MSSKRTLKTHEVISLKESELVSQLKLMSLEELEFHAKEIMVDMGAKNYPAVMSTVMKALETESNPDSSNQGTLNQNVSKFEVVQKAIEEALPNKAYLSDIYARLAAIVMSIIARKFQALL